MLQITAIDAQNRAEAIEILTVTALTNATEALAADVALARLAGLARNDGFALLARVEGLAAGVLLAIPNRSARLNPGIFECAIAVAPTMAGLGVSKALLIDALAQAGQAGARFVIATLTADAADHAFAAAQSLGFQMTGLLSHGAQDFIVVSRAVAASAAARDAAPMAIAA